MTEMNTTLRRDWIEAAARTLGFARVGIAAPDTLPRADYVARWLDEGRCGEMEYLRQYHPRRMEPRGMLSQSRSVIVVADLYRQTTASPDPAQMRIAQYAWGRDYHRVMRKKLKRLVRLLQSRVAEPFRFRICVDIEPLLERELAVRAGIGWIGKNTLVMHQDVGSFFFLGEVLTTLDIETSAPVADHCGNCTRCLEACPTGAFTAPYQMDASRCISYLTIEHRSEIAPALQDQMGNWLYGCDICQDVCPFNRKTPLTAEPAYAPRPERGFLPSHPNAAEIHAMSAEDHARVFAGSAIKRATLPMLQRNASIVERNRANKDGAAS